MSTSGRELTGRMREALALVDADRDDEAHNAFEQLLADSTAADYYDLPSVCGAFAAFKQKLGHMDEALVLHERALSETLRISTDPLSIAVYRYFFGCCLVELGRFSDAIAVLQPSVGVEERSDRFLLIPFARALWSMRNHDDARVAARRAIALAETDAQRQGVSKELEHVLADPDPA